MAVVYIIIAFLSFIPCININYKITGYTGIIALLITAYDFSKSARNIALRKSGRWERRSTYAFLWLMRFVLILSSIAFIYWFYKVNDKIVIETISNFVTFAAIGAVFLTKGMESRNVSSRVR